MYDVWLISASPPTWLGRWYAPSPTAAIAAAAAQTGNAANTLLAEPVMWNSTIQRG